VSGRGRRIGRPAWLLIALLAMMSGCAHGGRQGAGSVSEVHLFGVPVALNLDGAPGPDGIGVRIYASGPAVARGVEIRQGVLEVLMFDGSVDGGSVRGATARKVWALDAKDLKPLAAETSLGVGYQLALRWEGSRPRSSVVTVTARYRGPDGRELWSAANTISVALK
jgi:hypothetical protein